MNLDEAIDHISNGTATEISLWYETIGVDGAKRIDTAIQQNNVLTCLNLSFSEIGDEGTVYLAQGLKFNSTITALTLQSNSFGNEGARQIADALQQNKALTKLTITYNNIGDLGARWIAEALKYNSKLLTLSIQNAQIGREGAWYIAEALMQNNTLTALNLQGNEIAADGTRQIAEAMKRNTTLSLLDLTSNKIGPEGTWHIVESLKLNYSITMLNLQCNAIGTIGAKHVAAVLNLNNNITTLNLYDNRIGTEGTKYIAEALYTNTTVQSLDLKSNYIDDVGVKYIADALKFNSTLTHLDLSQNDFGFTGVNAISQVLATTTSLSSLKIEGVRPSFVTTDAYLAQLIADGLILQRIRANVLITRNLSVSRYIDEKEERDLLPIRINVSNKLFRVLPPNLRRQGLTLGQLIDFLRQPTHFRRRAKLFTVGYTCEGKTSLLDALYPLRLKETVDGIIREQSRFYELKGDILLQYTSADFKTLVSPSYLASAVPVRRLNHQWKVVEDRSKRTLQLFSPNSSHSVTLHFDNFTDLEAWFSRVIHSIKPARAGPNQGDERATIGIDVRPVIIDTSEDAIELSVWDFAGENEFYSNHHHFLNDKAIYVLVYSLEHLDYDKLAFWFRSLKSRLPPYDSDSEIAIWVVGTHLDKAGTRETKDSRRARLQLIVDGATGSEKWYPFEYDEVCCRDEKDFSFSGIQDLRRKLDVKADKLTGIGELTTNNTMLVETAVDALLVTNSALPIIPLSDLVSKCQIINAELAKDTNVSSELVKLHDWGRIIYFTTPVSLSEIVVLRPTFLTQDTMGALYRRRRDNSGNTLSDLHKFGCVTIAQVRATWAGKLARGQEIQLLQILNKLGLCFFEDPQVDQREISDSDVLLFPELLPETFFYHWPSAPEEGELEVCRILDFDVLPNELIAQVICQLHSRIVQNVVWRFGALLHDDSRCRCLLQAAKTTRGGSVTLRVRGKELAPLVRFLNFIVSTISTSANVLYPGIRMNEQVLCTIASAQPMNCYINVKDLVDPERRMNLSRQGCEGHHRFPDELEMDQMLVKGGVLATDGTPRLTPDGAFLSMATALPNPGNFPWTLESKCEYPCLYVLQPFDGTAGIFFVQRLVDAITNIGYDQHYLRPLCEMEIREPSGRIDRLYHPTIVEKKVVPHTKDWVNHLLLALKISVVLLQLGGSVASAVAGRVPEQIAQVVKDVADKIDSVKQVGERLKEGMQDAYNRGDTFREIERQYSSPQRLDSEAVEVAKNIFGVVDGHRLHMAGLTRITMQRHAPWAQLHKGECLWLCKEHHQLMEEWHGVAGAVTQQLQQDYAERARRIHKRSWDAYLNELKPK